MYGQMRPTMRRVSAQASVRRSERVDGPPAGRCGGADLPHVRLHEALQAQPADHQPGEHGDGQARRHVGQRDGRTEEAPEQHQGDLVNHRGADQEGERDAKRDAGLHEADEERHRRAAAEGRDHPEAGGGHGAGQQTAAGQRGAHPLRREEAAGEGDGGDDAQQQQQHLRHVHGEEGDRLAQVGAALETQEGEGQPLGQRGVGEPRDQPGGDGGHGQRGASAGCGSAVRGWRSCEQLGQGREGRGAGGFVRS